MSRRRRLGGLAGAIALAVAGCSSGGPGGTWEELEEVRSHLVDSATSQIGPIADAVGVAEPRASIVDEGSRTSVGGWTGELRVVAELPSSPAPSAEELRDLVESAGYTLEQTERENFFSARDEDGQQLALFHRDRPATGGVLQVTWSTPNLSLPADVVERAVQEGWLESTVDLDLG